MKEIKFNFENKDYLFFIQLNENKINLGIIELDKTELVELSEFEKEKHLKNILGLDYETLDKLEKKINPKSLPKIIQFINDSIFFYCDTETRKNLLEQNSKNRDYEMQIAWKVEL